MDDATLTVRICELLGRVPGWAWRPDSPYLPGEVAIFYGPIGDTPDQAIGVTVYDGTDQNHLHERRVQLRIRGARGARNGADQIAGFAFTVLQGLSRWDGINDARRVSFAPLGADQNDRQERSENYLVTLDNTEATL